jgi:hypothetical protein
MILLTTSLVVATQVASAQTITFSATNKTIPYPTTVVVQGDINRDGYPDFLFGLNASTNIYTYKPDGVGDYVDWTIPTQYCPSVPIALGNFQRNGKQDLLVSPTDGAQCVTYNPTFANYANDGTGIFKLYKQFALSGAAAQAAVVADFNGDKKLDAVVIDGVQLELYYGDGYGSFSGHYKITQLIGTAASMTGANVYNLISGDYDGNGCPDVAWTEYEPYGQRGFQSQLKVAHGDCKGGFSVVTQQNIIGEIDNIQTADLNRDGISDIVSALDASGQGVSNPTLQIFYGQNNRTLTPKLIKDAGLTGPIQLGDFNGDGYPDIAYNAVENSIAGVKIVEGDAAQSFATSSFYALPAGNSSLVGSGDYNRDGKTDLALLGSSGGNSQFTMLMNTSAYAQGACVQPATSGINVCSPGATSGTTINVVADANNPNPTVYMELWVDGVRRIGYGSTHELRTTLTLGVGTHQFAYFSADAAGNKNGLITNVKVQ